MSAKKNKLKRTSLFLAGAAVAAASLASTALPATADESHPRATAADYNIKSFPAVGTETGPDDITRLGGSLYVTFQNGVGPRGEPSRTGATASTIQQYGLDGKPGKSWQVTGKVDGLTAEPAHDRLLLTANEDCNSSFSTLNPHASNSLTHYTYVGLTHGGGTDAITVADGKIIVSASAPPRRHRPGTVLRDPDRNESDPEPFVRGQRFSHHCQRPPSRSENHSGPDRPGLQHPGPRHRFKV